MACMRRSLTKLRSGSDEEEAIVVELLGLVDCCTGCSAASGAFKLMAVWWGSKEAVYFPASISFLLSKPFAVVLVARSVLLAFPLFSLLSLKAIARP